MTQSPILRVLSPENAECGIQEPIFIPLCEPQGHECFFYEMKRTKKENLIDNIGCH